MTTRNFRVNNGISVGDIVIDASTNKITGLSTSAPTADGDVANKKYVDDGLAGLSQNSITQGNSNVTVTDTGVGSVTIAADGSTYLTVAAAATTVANALTASTTLGVTGNTTLSGNLSLTGSNKTVTLSPTGTGTVAISPAGALTINPTTASAMDNVVIGANTAKAGTFTQVTVNGSNVNTDISPTGTGTVTIAPAGSLTMGTAGVTTTKRGNITATTANQTINLSPTGTGTVTISPAGSLTLGTSGQTAAFLGSVRVNGDITVDGEQFIVNTTTLSVEDNIIELNRNVSSNAGVPTFSGLKVNRGETSSATEQDVFWVWDESALDDGSSLTDSPGLAGGCWTALRGTTDNDSGPSAISSQESSLVDIRCRIIYATATSAQYADIAERFAADAVMTPGAVVMFGGAQEITETAEELSDKVFGVVSTQPAYMMNSGAGNNDSHPFVAMTGRTPVRVTGIVNKGDRLVSSSVKGTARAARTGESINPFHVIGRALESKSDAGIGLVNCFVQAKN
ncbi:hypothetical protein EB001_03835 [bacterium]|nr:hypothetical protein [bacterium]